jgi:hypothetical protein
MDCFYKKNYLAWKERAYIHTPSGQRTGNIEKNNKYFIHNSKILQYSDKRQSIIEIREMKFKKKKILNILPSSTLNVLG